MVLSAMHINLLSFSSKLKTKQIDGDLFVFDPVRKKNVVLSPEEFVRQLLIQTLHLTFHIGFGRMIIERRSHFSTKSRIDLGVRKTDGTWSLLVECKSYKIPLTTETVLQLAKYQQHLHSEYAMVTNGKQTYIWRTGNDPIFITNDNDLRDRL